MTHNAFTLNNQPWTCWKYRKVINNQISPVYSCWSPLPPRYSRCSFPCGHSRIAGSSSVCLTTSSCLLCRSPWPRRCGTTYYAATTHLGCICACLQAGVCRVGWSSAWFWSVSLINRSRITPFCPIFRIVSCIIWVALRMLRRSAGPRVPCRAESS